MKTHFFRLKYLYITFATLFITVLFTSCINLFFGNPEKVYPQNIEVPGYGTLVYTETLFDKKDIKDTIVEGNIIWSLDYFLGKVYRYDTKTKKTITIDIEKQDKESYENVYNLNLYRFIIKNNTLFLSVLKNDDNKNYLAKIDCNTLSLSYTKMPDDFDNVSFWDGFYYNDTMYFRMWAVLADTISYTTTDFEHYTQITEDEYQAASRACPEYYSDTKNRLYRTEDHSSGHTETSLSVSIDNGNIWYEGDMGTNYANTVTAVNDTIYVSCHTYYEGIGFLPTGSTGGGLHIFKWKNEY